MFTKKPRPLSQFDKAQILSRLSQLMEQGYSLLQAIEIILASSSPKQRYWLKKIITSLEQGKSIEEGFRIASFSEYVSIMIAHAEWHGNMVLALQQASTWKQRKLQMKREWQKALTYPAMLMLLLVSIFYLLFYLVIPQFILLFQAFNVDMPTITMNTILILEWWQHVYPFLGFVVLFGLCLLFLALRHAQVKQVIIRGLLKVPWIKRLLQNQYTILFSLQLGSLLQANIPLNKSIHKVRENCGSTYLAEGLARMEQKILEGRSVAEVVKEEDFFSAELYPVIYYAEIKGLLGSQLVQYGILLETEVLENWLRRIKLIEPILLAGIGLFIAYLFYALFTPVLELIRLI